jgi:NADH:ubiquinone oxidoreductase subunit 6 (subunit J)
VLTGSVIIFYLLAALTLACGVLSVTTRHIFRAAIYLLFSLIGIAGIYFWLQYEFIAAVQIVVYAGGIAVLIIFSIFLTQQAGNKLPAQTNQRKIFALLAALRIRPDRLPYTAQFYLSASHRFNIDPCHQGQMLNVDQSGYAFL